MVDNKRIEQAKKIGATHIGNNGMFYRAGGVYRDGNWCGSILSESDLEIFCFDIRAA